MFNTVTAEQIKSLPPVEEVNIERLPELLSKIYAHILGLQTKYGEGQLSFVDREIKEDLNVLSKLSFTLEIYLESGAFLDNMSSIAYVAAMAHKLMGKLDYGDADELTLQTVPSEVISILLFIIGGYFADAQEIAACNSNKDEGDEDARLAVINDIKLLACGKLTKIAEREHPKINENSLGEIAEDSIWLHVCKGMRMLAAHLLGDDAADYHEYFQKVINLSHYNIGDENFVFAGPQRICRLLLMAAEALDAHATIHVVEAITHNNQERSLYNNIIFSRPYLWDNHLDAVQQGMLEFGTSSVITFPTGAGKSTLVELKILRTVVNGGKVLYLVPTHALEHQISRNMAGLFGTASVVGSQMDMEYTTIEDNGLDVMVMTPERCSTLQMMKPSAFDEIRLVVMDEFHVIGGDAENKNHRALGAMYCLLALLAERRMADFVLVSAMVENGEEIAQWISEITGRRCLNLAMTWKPTSQLQGCLIYSKKRLQILDNLCQKQKQTSGKKGKDFLKKLTAEPNCLFSLKNKWESRESNDYYLSPLLDKHVQLGVSEYWHVSSNKNEVALTLAQKFESLGMKTIIFVENAIAANSIAKKADVNGEKQAVMPNQKRRLEMIALELGGEKYSYVSRQMHAVQHHGLMLPEERGVAEAMFSGSVNIMSATPTLAQGINLPVDVVILAGDDRYDTDSDERNMLDAHEILNAAGRAGRAGFRSQGAAILIPSRNVTIDENVLGNRWFELKNEIFSKGDQCLKIKDPLSFLVNLDLSDVEKLPAEQKLVLTKLNLQGERKTSVIRSSFYSFQSRHDQERESSFVEKIISLASSIENDEQNPLMTLSLKSGVDIEVISSYYNWLVNNELPRPSVLNMLDYYLLWLLRHPDYLIRLVVYETTIKEMVELIQEDSKITEETIIKLHYILHMYVCGESLEAIQERLYVKRRSNQLKHARKMVLHVIPEVGYALGVLSMITVEYLQAERGMTEEQIPDEIKNFATYLKEGVLSDEMYQFKIKYHLMRVETHHKFRE